MYQFLKENLRLELFRRKWTVADLQYEFFKYGVRISGTAIYKWIENDTDRQPRGDHLMLLCEITDKPARYYYKRVS